MRHDLSMMAVTAAAAAMLTACSGQGPTAPEPIPTQTEVKTDEPQPAPPAPVPTPQPPAPQPTPAPKPADDIETYAATTDRATWTQGAVLPATFKVTLNYTKRVMQFGPLKVSMMQPADDRAHPFFKNGDATITVSTVTGTWNYNGSAGYASGTLRKVR